MIGILIPSVLGDNWQFYEGFRDAGQYARYFERKIRDPFLPTDSIKTKSGLRSRLLEVNLQRAPTSTMYCEKSSA
jgi:hypothetical protein